MSGKKKHKKTDAKAFRDYLFDRMSGEERNAFEKELQKDRFAGEALEGLSTLGEEEMEEDLKDLQARLSRNRETRDHRTAIYRIAAAVAGLIIVTSIYLAFDQKIRDLKTGRVARTEKNENAPETNTGPETLHPTARTPEAEGAGQAVETEIPAAKDQSGVKGRKSEPAAESQTSDEPAGDEFSVSTSERSPENQEAVAPLSSGSGKTLAGPGRETERSAEQQETTITRMAAPKKMTNPAAESGKVMTASESGALVQADDSGKVTMRNSESDAGTREEVIISSQDKDRSGFQEPLPAGGFKAFEDYIRKNLVFPSHHPDIDHASVTLKFSVNEKNRPDDIEVVQSPGDDFSEEAIRLLKKGPDWNRATLNDSVVDVKTRIEILFER